MATEASCKSGFASHNITRRFNGCDSPCPSWHLWAMWQRCSLGWLGTPALHAGMRHPRLCLHETDDVGARAQHWRRLFQCSKPVFAGYYMAMACSKIVAEALTITGSIGVISGKFNLRSLYERVGYTKTTLSRGR